MRVRDTFLTLGRAWCVLLCTTLGACLDDLVDEGEPLCRTTSTAPEFGRSWVLRGFGTRSGCDDPRFEGDFTLGPSQSLSLQRAEDGRLSLEGSSALELGGQVEGGCVSLSTRESTAEGTLRFSFEGAYEPDFDEVTGRFTGEGPGTCRLDGTFTLARD